MIEVRFGLAALLFRNDSRALFIGLSILVIVLSWSPGLAVAQRADLAPEGASAILRPTLATARRQMVVTANPHATRAALDVLREGGGAVDAAIAAQLVLGLVEPQSSGLGGGAFLLAWDAGVQRLYSYDGRETAPGAARPDRFLVEGKALPFREAASSGLSIGVPGLVATLELAHRTHGRLPWARLFEPAIEIAEVGFKVSQRLHALLAAEGGAAFSPEARALFFSPSGQPWAVGERLGNRAQAVTLRRLALGGSRAFYEGPVAEAIVAAVRSAGGRPGDMAPVDLASYRAIRREPVCVPYRRLQVCGMGPPSSGGLTVAMTLRLLAPHDLGAGPGAAMTPAALHLIVEAQRLAYADRDRYMADPDHVAVPRGLLAPEYLETRRALIDPSRAASMVAAGSPPGLGLQNFGVDATQERGGTTHISIIDAQGNAVSLTSSIESAFGSRLMAAGFLLNNQLTDFSFLPVDAEGRLVANAVAPGKRPRSSMAPTIVLDARNEVQAVVGSPGGSRIILYVLKALVGAIDWQLDAQAIADLPSFGSRGAAFEIEARFAAHGAFLAQLGYGHRLAPDVMTSGLNIILRREGRLEGGTDPRREGLALGD